MTDNISLFSNNCKVTGKVDLQYVLPDGTVQHHTGHNKAFSAAWSATGLVQQMLIGTDIDLLLTDYDGQPDVSFPFLQGNTVGAAYTGSTARGKYLGTEITNKRVISTNGNKLTISRTYEWLSSQIPGTIRSIGYTMQFFEPSEAQMEYGKYSIPVLSCQRTMSYYNLRGVEVLDINRRIGYKVASFSTTSANNTINVSSTMYSYSTVQSTTYVSFSFKHVFIDHTPYDYYLFENSMLYDADTGSTYLILGYYLKETSSSDYEYHRRLIRMDVAGKQCELIWDVILGTSADKTYYPYYICPLYPEYSLRSDKWLVKKGDRIFVKIASHPVYMWNAIVGKNKITTCIYSFPYATLNRVLSIDDLTFFPSMPSYVRYDGLMVVLNTCSGASSSTDTRMWVISELGDLCFFSESENARGLDVNGNNVEASCAFNLIIMPDKNKITCVPMARLSEYNNDPASACIEHASINGEETFFSRTLPTVSNGNGAWASLRYCTMNTICQALTWYSVPEEAQQRPANSGVRIVYELTFENGQ